MVVLVAVVVPLKTVFPVRASVPAPRRNPPPTAAELSVSVAPLAASNTPSKRVNMRDVEVVVVYRRVPNGLTVIGPRPSTVSFATVTTPLLIVRPLNWLPELPRMRVPGPALVSTPDGTVTGPSGVLTKAGPGTLILGNSGNQFNGLTINNGVVTVANDTVLGLGPITVNPFGTLRYTTTTSTSRMFTLFDGVLEAASGATLTLNSAAVGGGFLRGAGTLALTGNTVLSGTTTATSTTINQTGPATV